jgi:hypothetical protein
VSNKCKVTHVFLGLLALYMSILADAMYFIEICNNLEYCTIVVTEQYCLCAIFKLYALYKVVVQCCEGLGNVPCAAKRMPFSSQ